MKKGLNFIDVFCGAGGFSCGLEMAGWNCVLGIDHDKYAIETFRLNHSKAQSYLGDISKLSNAKIKKLLPDQKIDLIVGGPPCQGFSTVGPGRPEDQRNQLFRQFMRLVKCFQPEFVVIENVTGLLAKKNEKTLKAIFQYFTRLGYHLDAKVLQADHYGVPERRRRTIVIARRSQGAILYPKITNHSSTVGEVLKNLKTNNGKVFNHDLQAASISSALDLKRIKRIPEGASIRYEKDEKSYLTKSLTLGINWDEIPEKRLRQAKYQRLNSKTAAPTIMTHRHSYYHPCENRYLTAREAAAIQSFPNSFVFSGPQSAQWRQIGNAVPPLLAKAIGKCLLTMRRRSQQKNTQENKITSPKVDRLRERAFHYRAEI